MIEILIMLFGVFPWFYRTAKRQRRSPIGWIVVGALSYYIPLAIVNRAIMPALLEGQITMDNFVAMNVLSITLSVGAGIGSCFLARQMLLSGDRPHSSTTSVSHDPSDSSTDHLEMPKASLKWLCGAYILAFVASYAVDSLLDYAYGRKVFALNWWHIRILADALVFALVLVWRRGILATVTAYAVLNLAVSIAYEISEGIISSGGLGRTFDQTSIMLNLWNMVTSALWMAAIYVAVYKTQVRWLSFVVVLLVYGFVSYAISQPVYQIILREHITEGMFSGFQERIVSIICWQFVMASVLYWGLRKGRAFR